MKSFNFDLFLQLVFVFLLVNSVVNLIVYVTGNVRGDHVYTARAQDEKPQNFAFIAGSVNNPGVYSLGSNTRIIDLINEAGGLDDNTDYNTLERQINLSQRVFNEDHIYVPSRPLNQSSQGGQVQPVQTSSTSNSALINVNTASQAQLESLPGIGPATAQKIISGRPYASVDELDKVSGIGPATIAKLKPYVSVN